MPLRAADIAPAGPGTRQRPDCGLADPLPAESAKPYQPEHITVVRLASSRPVLRVEYGAPSPPRIAREGLTESEQTLNTHIVKAGWFTSWEWENTMIRISL